MSEEEADEDDGDGAAPARKRPRARATAGVKKSQKGKDKRGNVRLPTRRSGRTSGVPNTIYEEEDSDVDEEAAEAQPSGPQRKQSKPKSQPRAKPTEATSNSNSTNVPSMDLDTEPESDADGGERLQPVDEVEEDDDNLTLPGRDSPGKATVSSRNADEDDEIDATSLGLPRRRAAPGSQKRKWQDSEIAPPSSPGLSGIPSSPGAASSLPSRDFSPAFSRRTLEDDEESLAHVPDSPPGTQNDGQPRKKRFRL